MNPWDNDPIVNTAADSPWASDPIVDAPANTPGLASATKREEPVPFDTTEKDPAEGLLSQVGSSLKANLIGARQGVTLGFNDEMTAGLRAAGDWLGGKPLGESYKTRVAAERALLDQTREKNPAAMLAGEIGGAVAFPAGAATKATTTLGAMAQGAKAGAGFGAVAGVGNADGQSAMRGAVEGATVGSLFGAGSGAAVSIGTKAYRRVMGRVAAKPTTEGLHQATKVAYKAVDDAGEVFQPAELQTMVKGARDAVQSGNYVADVDAQTRASLELLERNSGTPMSLGRVDKLRQNLWKRYNAAPNETGILDAIDAIDTMIQSRTASSELMDAARQAHAQYKKAELLENAFKKAQDQTSSTGSGGNILNKYRQAVTNIVNDPKRSKNFQPEELAVMQQVIDGSVPENILRRVGKLSPSGNGLMLFLNIMGGTAMGPAFLPITAAGAGAKALSDRSALSGVDSLMGKVMGRAPEPPVGIPTNALAGYLGSK